MRFLGIILILAVLLFSPSLALAAKPAEIPEVSGDYPDPENKKVRVRVFVHGFKDKDKLQVGTQAVCNDPNSSAFVGATGWKLPAGTWQYNLNPASVPSSVGPSNLAPLTVNGFFDFESQISSAAAKPVLRRGSDTSKIKSSYDGLNIIAWGRTSGSTLGVTYVRYYVSSGLVVDVDTIMNKRVPWSWSGGTSCGDPNSYDAENILTHEIGHWFGLDDEYEASYVDNTMFGYGDRNEVKKDTLTTGDANGVKAIYP